MKSTHVLLSASNTRMEVSVRTKRAGVPLEHSHFRIFGWQETCCPCVGKRRVVPDEYMMLLAERDNVTMYAAPHTLIGCTDHRRWTTDWPPRPTPARIWLEALLVRLMLEVFLGCDDITDGSDIALAYVAHFVQSSRTSNCV